MSLARLNESAGVLKTRGFLQRAVVFHFVCKDMGEGNEASRSSKYYEKGAYDVTCS